MLEDTIQILTEQMIREHFKNTKQNRYIITKQELYEFSIKLIKLIKEIEER